MQLTSAIKSALDRAFSPECDLSLPLTPFERVCGGLALLMPILGLLLVGAVCGCKAFYENAGMHVRMGSLTAPVEFTEPSDSITVRALYGMDGIDMYAAKGCVATMSYTNVYSNSFAFGLFNWSGTQTGAAQIEPTVDEPTTNAVDVVR